MNALHSNTKKNNARRALLVVASAVLLLIIAVWQAVTLIQSAGMMCLGGGIYVIFDTWLVAVYLSAFLVVPALLGIAWLRRRRSEVVRSKRFTILALMLVMASWLVAGLSLLAAICLWQ